MQEFNNQEVEIELTIRPVSEQKPTEAKLVADAFFVKINKNIVVNFDELNVYDQ